jgi:hypothetical protein
MALTNFKDHTQIIKTRIQPKGAGELARKCIHTSRSCLFALTIIPVFLVFFACGQPRLNNNHTNELKFDTTKTAILELKYRLPWVFDSTCKSTKLTQKDLGVIEGFLIKSVNDFNDWQVKNNLSNSWKIDLKSQDYKKQIIAVTNKKGEKEVWINCFCSDHHPDWKVDPVGVSDGGTCYFNFKINLTTNTYYDFRVNGEA